MNLVTSVKANIVSWLSTFVLGLLAVDAMFGGGYFVITPVLTLANGGDLSSTVYFCDDWVWDRHDGNSFCRGD